jgi:hypothetical protein
MCWTCDHPGATQQDWLDHLGDTIARCGHAVIAVAGDRLHAPLAYTVGLTAAGLPELVVTGKRPAPATRLLDDVAHHVRFHDGLLTHGQQVGLSHGLVEVVDLPHPEAHLFDACAYYGAGVRAQQLVWADDRGTWPWEVGHRGGRGGQPVLGPRRP